MAKGDEKNLIGALQMNILNMPLHSWLYIEAHYDMHQVWSNWF